MLFQRLEIDKMVPIGLELARIRGLKLAKS